MPRIRVEYSSNPEPSDYFWFQDFKVQTHDRILERGSGINFR